MTDAQYDNWKLGCQDDEDNDMEEADRRRDLKESRDDYGDDDPSPEDYDRAADLYFER